jgi:hypothetical protein
MAERNRKAYSQRAYDIIAEVTGMPKSSDLARAKAGAAARTAKLTPEQRSEIAKKAAATQWSKKAEPGTA